MVTPRLASVDPFVVDRCGVDLGCPMSPLLLRMMWSANMRSPNFSASFMRTGLRLRAGFLMAFAFSQILQCLFFGKCSFKCLSDVASFLSLYSKMASASVSSSTSISGSCEGEEGHFAPPCPPSSFFGMDEGEEGNFAPPFHLRLLCQRKHS